MNPYALPHIAGSVIALSLCIAVLLIRKKDAPLILPFSFSLLCVFMWLLTRGLVFLAENEKVALLVSRFGYLGVIFLPIAFYRFSLSLTGKRDRLLAFIYATGALFSFVSIFTPHLLSVYRVKWGVSFRAGPVHPAFLAFFAFAYYKSLRLLYKAGYADGDSANSMKARYVLWAYAVGSLGALDFLLDYGIRVYPFGFLFATCGVIIITYAVLKHQLVDINVVLEQSLVYSILIGLITPVYVLAVFLAEGLFKNIFGYSSLVASLVAATFIAIFFQPAKTAIERFLDRAFFRGTPQALTREIERLKERMKEADKLRAVATLAAGMAHEIKNPLSSIKTFAEYLPQKYQDEAFREKFQRIIACEVSKINDIVQQLLDFAKPKPPQLTQVNLNKLLDETLALLNNELIKKDIDTAISYGSNSRAIMADPVQLKQAFLNIFLNGIEAMERGGKVSISTRADGNNFCVEIADTGVGIADKDIPRIFEPFFSTKEKGAGLGLSIVHSIIAEHKGSIDVKSKPGSGTTFVINLPLSLQTFTE